MLSVLPLTLQSLYILNILCLSGPGAEDVPAAAPATGPFVVVLGTAQDAGYPQAGCSKPCCERAWRDPSARRRVSCLAIVDPASGQRWMIDATPDFRVQLRLLDEIQAPCGTPGLDGILLTHGHIGHYTGLMFLGHESIGAKDVPVYVMPRMHTFLSNHGPWDQLVRYKNIELKSLSAGHVIQLNARIQVTAIRVPHREEYTEVVGFQIAGPERSVLFIPDIDKWDRWDRDIADLIHQVDVAYLDGTFFDDGEVAGRDMSAIPHPFITESIRRLGALPADERAKVHFIHFNHTNPVLDSTSTAAQRVQTAGFKIAQDLERTPL